MPSPVTALRAELHERTMARQGARIAGHSVSVKIGGCCDHNAPKTQQRPELGVKPDGIGSGLDDLVKFVLPI